MKNLKITKILTLVLVAIMIVSSVSPKVVLSKEDSIDGYYVKGKIAINIDSSSMTIGVYRKGERHGACYGEYQPVGTNEYSVRLHDKLDMYESGYFNMIVKKNKLKLKWRSGDYKYLKGTWKYKNWSHIPQSWAYKYE